MLLFCSCECVYVYVMYGWRMTSGQDNAAYQTGVEEGGNNKREQKVDESKDAAEEADDDSEYSELTFTKSCNLQQTSTRSRLFYCYPVYKVIIINN